MLFRLSRVIYYYNGTKRYPGDHYTTGIFNWHTLTISEEDTGKIDITRCNDERIFTFQESLKNGIYSNDGIVMAQYNQFEFVHADHSAQSCDGWLSRKIVTLPTTIRISSTSEKEKYESYYYDFSTYQKTGPPHHLKIGEINFFLKEREFNRIEYSKWFEAGWYYYYNCYCNYYLF